jgi:hypothetical protein
MPWKQIDNPSAEIYVLDLGNKLSCQICRQHEETQFSVKVFQEFSVKRPTLTDAKLYCKDRAKLLLSAALDEVCRA